MDFDPATFACFLIDCGAFFSSEHADLRALIESFPRKSDDDGLQLFVAQCHAEIMSDSGADEASFVKFPRAEPEAKAIVHQHLHAIRTFVDEEIGVMGARFAEHAHDASQRLVGADTHVERLDREPSRIDADHLINSRSSNAHSCAADAGHSMLTVPPWRRTLIRIVPSA